MLALASTQQQWEVEKPLVNSKKGVICGGDRAGRAGSQGSLFLRHLASSPRGPGTWG